MKIQYLSTIALALYWSSEVTLAADIDRGRILHQENCIQCHASMYGGDGTTIYVREERRIDSLQGLTMQVKRCKNSLGLPWPEDQTDDLIAYLNTMFYHFTND